MPATPGTLETIVVELGSIITPLKDDLNPAGARGLLLQLGVPLTDTQISSITTPMGTLVTGIEDILTDVSAIITAIGASDEATIIQKGEDAITKIQTMMTAIQSLAAAVKALAPVVSDPTFLDDLALHLLYFLLAKYLDRVTGLNEVLELFGILERQDLNTNSDDPTQPAYTINTFHFDRFGGWFSQPSTVLQNLYDWGSASFDGTKLFPVLEQILTKLGLPVLYDDTATPPTLDIVVFELTPATDVSPRGLYIQLKSVLASGDIQLNQDPINVDLKVDFQTPPSTKLLIQPNGNISFVPPSGSSALTGDLMATMTVQNQATTDPFIIFGQTGSSRLQIGAFVVQTGVTVTWDGTKANGDFQFQAGIKQGNVYIDTSNGDGFLSTILGGTNVQGSFDCSIGVSTARGFYFNGSSGLEVNLPAHIDLGPVSIEGLTLAVGINGSTIPVSLGANIDAQLGPLSLVVNNLGVTCTFSFPANGGNLGLLDLQIGFKPPNGVGVTVDTGMLTGGGFLYLDPAKGQYYGAIELEFQDLFSLKAVGIINTIFPDGSKGFSMLIIITADFTPIQLGFGFTLNGVGGLLGVNRTTQVDALRQGIKTNAISNVLFPTDVIDNISQIVSDLQQIFPVFQGHYVVGPMAELGWGDILTLEIGILLEIPNPIISILGVIKAQLPEDAPLLTIQINFLGVIDFDNKYISFDASLYDSNLLIYVLTGDMAFRLSWGDNPFFLLSVGGFNPAFHDAPTDLQNMVRLGVSLLNNSDVKVDLQCYFAVTSNTVQFGAEVQLFAGDSGGFNVYGNLGFDVLFQFKPFLFTADIYASLSLRHGTSVIMGISLSGQLSGPTPWNAQGSASISLLFFSVSVSFQKTWGNSGQDSTKQLIDIVALLVTAIGDGRNWKADNPDNNSQHVSIKQLPDTGDDLVIHPFGILSFSETIVPLDLDITHFGDGLPLNADYFDIGPADASLAVTPQTAGFAKANFFDMTDDQKLSEPSFDPMKSGFMISNAGQLVVPDTSLQPTDPVALDVDYRLSYLRPNTSLPPSYQIYGIPKDYFQAGLLSSAPALSTLSAIRNRVPLNAPDPVPVTAGQYAVAGVADMKLASGTSLVGSYAEAQYQYDQLVKNQPALQGRYQIVNDYELNSN